MARDSRGRYLPAAVELSLIDRLTAPLRRITKNFEALSLAGKRASKAFRLSADLKHSADNVEDFSRKVGDLVQKPIKKFMDFEEQMSSVKAATFDLTKSMDTKKIGEMNEAMAAMAATARQLGSDSERFGASDVAAGMDLLSKNFGGDDLKKAQDVMDAMPGILDAATALKGSIEETADISTAAMNQFGLAANDMGRIGDVLTKTANGSATGLTDLGEALKYSGVSAKAAGLDIETTLGIIGALGNAGKKGSQAGPGLSSVLSNLQSGMKKQKSALRALGIDIKDDKGNFRNVVDVMTDVNKAADKKFGAGTGGVRRDRWVQGMMGAGSDKEVFTIMMKTIGTGELQALVKANYDAGGSAKKVADEMSNNTSGAAKELDSALEELQLTIGERVIPEVKDLLKWSKGMVDGLADWSKEHPTLVKGLAGLAGGLALTGLVIAPILAGVATLTTLFGGLTFAVGIAKTAFLVLRGVVRAHPLLAMCIAVATATHLIYENWEPIKQFFSDLWDGVTAAFKVALDWIVGKLEWVMARVEEAKAALTDPFGTSNLVIQHIEAIKAGQAAANDPAMLAASADWAAGLVRGAGDLSTRFAGEGPPSPAAPPLHPGEAPSSQFKGELKVTIDAEGQVARTEMKRSGAPGFAVKANRGGQ